MQNNFHNTHIKQQQQQQNIAYAKQQGESHETSQEHFLFIFDLKERKKIWKWLKKIKPI